MKPTAGWYPVRLERRQDGEIMAHWQDMTNVSFTDPFFEDTMRRTRRGGQVHRLTTLAELSGVELPPAIAPNAFIFHASRSGSTLLTQWISCLAGCVALSEPPVVEELLQLPCPPEEKVAHLQMLVRALAQSRSGGDRHFLIKFDSWHVAWLPVIRQAFPGTTCLFIYRHPVEILRSHHRQRGSQMVPGLRNLERMGAGLTRQNPADLDAHAAGVLESVFSQALKFVRTGSLIPLEYTSLVQDPAGVIERLGILLCHAEQDAIRERSRFHSKQLGTEFAAELERSIPEPIRLRLEELAAPVLMPAYEALRGCDFEWW